MAEASIGSAIWRTLTPGQAKMLREAAKRALIRAGCHPQFATDREADKWIESRLPATIEKYQRVLKDRGFT